MRKLIRKSFHRKDKGFTLIELLIVIVIIGILAGVLIAVINPVRQQNRSRNAAVRASLLKAAFAINTVRAGIGTLPSNAELTEELENTRIASTDTPYGTACAFDGTDCLNALVEISGTQMPNVCSGDSVNPDGSDAGECYMHIIASSDDLLSGMFRIAAAKFYLNPANPVEEIFLFDSNLGLLLCPAGTVY